MEKQVFLKIFILVSNIVFRCEKSIIQHEKLHKFYKQDVSHHVFSIYSSFFQVQCDFYSFMKTDELVYIKLHTIKILWFCQGPDLVVFW